MSPSPEVEDREPRSVGFTLIEVMVALGIFMVLAAAVAPLLVGGLRSAAVARDITQSKGVAQAKIEEMRNLPFYVGWAAGDYKDVLDTYYRDLTPPTVTPSCATSTLSALPPTDWKGFVDTSAIHCSWEPAGPLYRKVINPVVAPGLGVFSMVVSTQFLTGGATPTWVAPGSDYTSHPTSTAGNDNPPSTQIGITVAVFYKSPSGVHYTVTYSQAEQGNVVTPMISSRALASTVRISSALNADTSLLEQLGVINLTGELYTGSRVVTTAAAATAGDSLGQEINGAQVNLVAPVDQSPPAVNPGGVQYPTTGCTLQCFGDTKVDQATALASNGLPRAGTATAPVRAMIPSSTNYDGFRFSNSTAPDTPQLGGRPMVSLDTSSPAPNTMQPMSACAPVAGSVGAYLTGTGFLDATSNTVSSCATAQSNVIRLFPTDFAHDGVVRITLSRATAFCSVTKGNPSTATAAYQAKVSYWNGIGYTDVPLASTDPTDPLAGVNLDQEIDAQSHLKLKNYIQSWRSLTSAGVKTSPSTTTSSADASLPSVLSITTQQTRTSDPLSVISIDIGTVSCSVSDRR